MNNCIAVILAGGKGTRLDPLTRDQAKPAVPFGGAYRIIDFALSNCLNSGLRRLLILTQYKAFTLDRHITTAWNQYFCHGLGEFVHNVPPQHNVDEHWYCGTADAVYQNIRALEQERPEHIVVLAGDHIYKMNYRRMAEFHKDSNADLTIGALRVSPHDAKRFGVMQVDEDRRLTGFTEKPDAPQCIPGDDVCLASMGIYIFKADFLFEELCRDAANKDSTHDFGKDIIPSMIDTHRVFAFPFQDENRKQQAYWRDVGNIDAFYEANMDLVAVDPELNLYDERWPIRTDRPSLPPPKFVFCEDSDPKRVGQAHDSMVGLGSIISGGTVKNSVLGRNIRVDSLAMIESSILFDNVQVGEQARIRRAILDTGVIVPPHAKIGFDAEGDRRRGLTVTESGITVVTKDCIEQIDQTGTIASRVAIEHSP